MTSEKPVVKLIGEDGNVFNLIGKTAAKRRNEMETHTERLPVCIAGECGSKAMYVVTRYNNRGDFHRISPTSIWNRKYCLKHADERVEVLRAKLRKEQI